MLTNEEYRNQDGLCASEKCLEHVTPGDQTQHTKVGRLTPPEHNKW
jgi:hypothetical protein